MRGNNHHWNGGGRGEGIYKKQFIANYKRETYSKINFLHVFGRRRTWNKSGLIIFFIIKTRLQQLCLISSGAEQQSCKLKVVSSNLS